MSPLPDPWTPRAGATLCALDSWVWVQLTAARRDPAHALRAVWQTLLTAAQEGLIQVALTSGNYLELWNRADGTSRRHVARTMAELSGYVTVRAVHEVVIEETRRLIERRRALSPERAGPLRRDDILGVGARHAFGAPLGRIRFVERLTDHAGPEGEEIPPPADVSEALAALSPAEFEWLSLAGFDESHDIPGIDYRPAHREGDEWVESQEQLRAFATAPGSDQSLLYRTLVLQRLRDVFDQVGPDAITRAERASWFAGPVDGVGFITALPTQQVLTELLYAAHRNPGYAFRQHDRIDVHDLALTIPYCDVIVPDTHWAHLARSTRLDREHGTRVLQGQGALRLWAGELYRTPDGLGAAR